MKLLKTSLTMPKNAENTIWLMEHITWILAVLGSCFAFLFFGYKFKMAELQAKTEKQIREEEIAARKERDYVFNLVKETTKGSIEAILNPALEDIRHSIKQVNENLDRKSQEHKEDIKELRQHVFNHIKVR